MTKIKPVNKNKNYFEKISFSFFTLAYSFMFLSFAYFFINKPESAINNKDVSINVVGTNLEKNSKKDEDVDIIKEPQNPNVFNEQGRLSILNNAGRKETVINYILIDSKGNINSPELTILVGDTVSFLNSSEQNININFGNWQLSNISVGNTLSQDFFKISTYTYKVEPFNTTGVINVVNKL